MRKKMTILLISLICLLAMVLSGCGRYTSSWSAVGCAQSNTSDSAFVSFYKLSGKMVFKLKSDVDEEIHYQGKLKSGSLTVYYDTDGTKKELFSMKSGEEVDDRIGDLQKGTTYIIIETDERCENGDLHFDLQEISGENSTETED